MHLNNLALALGLASSIAPAEAFFRMSCPGRLVRERVDPIVNPGAVAPHVHLIAGGSGFGASMTYEQARASKCSSCEIQEDLSNYWTPSLYVKFKNGTFAPVPVIGDPNDTGDVGMVVYYLQRPGSRTEKLHAYPEGFRMLAGDSAKRNFTGGLDAKAISFNCLGANKAETNNIPNYNCPGGLRAQIFFPSCWNGKDLDSADHMSHMSYFEGNEYNTGNCPPEFPKHMISVFFEILYDTDRFKDEWDGDQHPFVFSNGDTTGYGFHGDFVNGWDVDVLQEATDTCLDDSGQVSKCGAVTMFSGGECKACKLPSRINEETGGILEKLPGCNELTSGPERATPAQDCPATKFGDPAANYADLTSTKQWEYVGCGTDNIGDRAFTGDSTSSDDMTVEKCVDYCSGAGFSYAGLEYGRECYCANQLDPDHAPKDGIFGNCNMKCAGDSKQICGNAAAMSIYHKCGSTCKNNQIGGGGSSNDTAPAPSSQPSASAAPSASKAATTLQPSRTTPPTSALSNTRTTAAPTTTPSPPACPRNNCINQIFNPTASVSASSFCATFTQSVVTAASAIPDYLHNCYGEADTVSSACTCLGYYPTGLPQKKAKRVHARDVEFGY